VTKGTKVTKVPKAPKGYHKLLVWQRARELVREIYKLTAKFPKSELFGLTSQMRRAAVSVVANIVEEHSRYKKSRKEALQFFSIAEGSLAELEAHLEIALDVIGGFKKNEYERIEKLRGEVGFLLHRFVNSLHS
jgi:four helix bundle protein